MKDQRFISIAASFRFVNGINHTEDFHLIGKGPGDDLVGEEIHDARKVNKAINSPDVGYIGTPDGIGAFRIKLLVQYVMQLL